MPSIFEIYGSRKEIAVSSNGVTTAFSFAPCKKGCPYPLILAFDRAVLGGSMAVDLKLDCGWSCLGNKDVAPSLPLLMTVKAEQEGKGSVFTFDDGKIRMILANDGTECARECRKGKLSGTVGGVCRMALFDLAALVLGNGLARVWWVLAGGRVSQEIDPKAKRFFRYWVFPDGVCVLCLTPFSEVNPSYPYSLWISEGQFDALFAQRKVLARKECHVVFAPEDGSALAAYRLQMNCGW